MNAEQTEVVTLEKLIKVWVGQKSRLLLLHPISAAHS